MKKITDSDIKAGDIVNANGIPIHVYSDEEMERSVDEEGLTIVCCPVDICGNIVEGSTIGRCGACGRDVWVSPSSRESVPVGAPIRCSFCILDQIKKERSPQKIVSTEWQTKEIKEKLEKDDPWWRMK